MFIDLTHNARTNSVRRSGIQLEPHHSESFRSSERSRRGSLSRAINMSPLTGVKPTVNEERRRHSFGGEDKELSSMNYLNGNE